MFVAPRVISLLTHTLHLSPSRGVYSSPSFKYCQQAGFFFVLFFLQQIQIFKNDHSLHRLNLNSYCVITVGRQWSVQITWNESQAVWVFWLHEWTRSPGMKHSLIEYLDCSGQQNTVVFWLGLAWASCAALLVRFGVYDWMLSGTHKHMIEDGDGRRLRPRHAALISRCQHINTLLFFPVILDI